MLEHFDWIKAQGQDIPTMQVFEVQRIDPETIYLIFGIPLTVILTVVFIVFYNNRRVIDSVLATITAVLAMMYVFTDWLVPRESSFRVFLMVAAAGFVSYLYLKWVNGYMSDDEKQPNMVGIRAWLSYRHILFCILASMCASLLIDSPNETFFLRYACLFVILLLTYPILNMLSHVSEHSKKKEDDSCEATLKIIDMLEQNKITHQEAKDLVKALHNENEVEPEPVEEPQPQAEEETPPPAPA